MVTSDHFQRLKHLYRSSRSTTSDGDLIISYGRAKLDGSIDPDQPDGFGATIRHHHLLRDVASLAAGTVEKDCFVTADTFTLNIVDSTYTGPIEARAEVVLAEPPRYIVEAVLVTPEDDLVAKAHGVFQPGDTPLPAETTSGDHSDPAPPPPPASFMPVHTTPYGVLCLN